jgi:hypothetical protein
MPLPPKESLGQKQHFDPKALILREARIPFVAQLYSFPHLRFRQTQDRHVEAALPFTFDE